MVAPGGFDMISCGPLARRDSGDALWEERKLGERAYSVPDRFRVEVRTTTEEVDAIGRLVGEKLSRTQTAARVVIPTGGWSSLSTQGEQLYDPVADAAFAPALRETLTVDIPVEEHELELNTDEFAEVLAGAIHEMIVAQDTGKVGAN